MNSPTTAPIIAGGQRDAEGRQHVRQRGPGQQHRPHRRHPPVAVPARG
ncbi:hypothetical protein [Nonomuraea rubra]